MRLRPNGYFLLLFTFCTCAGYAQVSDFNNGWKFHLGHASDAKQDFNYSIVKTYEKTGKAKGTCIMPGFLDSNWQNVQLPHDWAAALPFEFNSNKDVEDHGYKPIAGLYPQNSIGWYRKTFDIPASDSGNRISLRFDGINRDSKVWVNGFYAGNHFSGYTSFTIDITDFINWGGKNVVVIRADASQYEGWFYEGAGIYRNAWLVKQNNLHIQPDDIFVHSIVSSKNAVVTVEGAVSNKDVLPASCSVFTYLTDRQGKKVGQSVKQPLAVKAKDAKSFVQQITIASPHLWDLDDPYLYRVVTVIKNKGGVLNETTTRFGIRTIVIDAVKGLFLNGKNIKIKGVCCHQDHAGVGVAVPTHLQYYRTGLLKEMGANAYRSSHHAPSPDVLDACDSLGLLVLDETRLLNSSAEYMQQFENLVRRDRNHPSIFMWCIGNEEDVAQNNSHGKRIAQSMIALQQKLDPTRTCTYAANNGKVLSGVNEVIPVRGVNYNLNEIDAYHLQRPLQPIIGTELGSTVTTRGQYTKDTVLGYLPDHDINFPPWATTAEKWWTWVSARPWFMGAFVWTGFDYGGEPTPFKWPNTSSHFGIMDICGFPKNNYYYYQSWWGNKDVLQLSPHWNHAGKEGQPIDVWVNSNANTVELLLNDKSLSKKEMPQNGHLQWSVPYQPGKLKAIGYKNGKQFQASITTTGKASQIILAADRDTLPAGDVCIVNITVSDSEGRLVPDAAHEISFNMEGRAYILGTGNGDPSSHGPARFEEKNSKIKLFNGQCQLIVQAGSEGRIKIYAISEGLKSSMLEIICRNEQ